MATNGAATAVPPPSYGTCKQVSAICPVSATVLGYYPNLGSGIFFTIAFGLCMVVSAVLTVRKRTWSYGAGITIGLALEMAGYISRILMHSNPWNQNAFQLQLALIIIAPTFICVSIYLTLKHVALTLKPSASRLLRPRWYPVIFLPADLACLVVQAIGGGIAAAAGSSNSPSLVAAGNRAIVAGVALQVVVLLVFAALAADHFLRARAYVASPRARGTEALRVWRDARFRRFAFAVLGAFVVILIRCIYRIAEMAGGWGNPIMQDETSFLILDSTLVVVAAYLLTFFHPGILFPQMRNGQSKRVDDAAGNNNEESKEEVGSSSEGPKVES